MSAVSRLIPAAISCLAVLAGLCPSTVLAATATIVASESKPNAGDTFFVTVSGADFPETTGATLGLTWNSEVVSVTGTELVSGSPFSDLLAESPWDMITILAPPSGTLPSGNFEAFRVTFKALEKGDANITLVDDGGDLSWTDVDAAPIPVTYTQASVKVVTPLPPAAWLMGSALGGLGLLRRKKPS